jgi:SAM-dependent methyltransferase
MLECRGCGLRHLESVFNQDATGEPGTAATLVFCPDCLLVQAGESAPPDRVFGTAYQSLSADRPGRIRGAAETAQELTTSFGLGPDSLVLELGSNDGTLLRAFFERGVRTLGVDPAPLPTRAAADAGIPTIRAFFVEEVAGWLVRQGQAADLVVARDVLGEVAEINDFVAGIARVLKPDGRVAVEFVSIVDRIESGVAEERCGAKVLALSLSALDRLFRRHGLHLNDAKRLASGAIRALASSAAGRSPALEALLAEERESGVERAEFYRRAGAANASAADGRAPAPLLDPTAIAARRRATRSAAAAG